MPTIDFTGNERAAVTAAIRRTIEEDSFPHAPRLEPLLRAGKARSDGATTERCRRRPEAASGRGASKLTHRRRRRQDPRQSPLPPWPPDRRSLTDRPAGRALSKPKLVCDPRHGAHVNNLLTHETGRTRPIAYDHRGNKADLVWRDNKGASRK